MAISEKVLAGLEPHQVRAVKRLSSNATGGLFHGMGCGKTAVGVRIAEAQSAETILVICPKNAVPSWLRELKLWSLVKRTVYVVSGKKDRIPPKAAVVLCTYDFMASVAIFRQLRSRAWDNLFIDEAHRLKNPDARRSMLVYGTEFTKGSGGLIDYARRIYPMTGTPTPNFPVEIWTHAHALCPERIQSQTGKPMTYASFRGRYVVMKQNQYGPVMVAARNTGELRQRLQGWFDRTTLKKIRKSIGLGRLRLTVTPLPVRRIDRSRVMKLLADKDAKPLERVLYKAGAFDATDDEILELAKSDPLATVRKAVGLLKAPIVADQLLDELDEGQLDKIIVFAWHHEVIDILANAMRAYHPLVVTGKTNVQDRGQAEYLFQEDPTRRVYIGQLLAAGEASTLTAANQVALVESNFVPGDVLQAVYRAYRYGQTGSVQARFFALADTLDEALQDILTRKAKANHEMWD